MDIANSSAGIGLHSRKKAAQYDDPEDMTQISPSAAKKSKVHRRSSFAVFRSELGCAIEVVVLFLICGLFLGYFAMHHQHRNIVYHLAKDPVGHRAFFQGRVGFRHHFYTGNPKTVTVVIPSVVNPKKRKRRLDSIFETWGPSARALYVVHNVSEFPQADPHAVLSDTSKPKDPYSYPQILLVPPTIGFDDGLPRLTYVIRSVYEKIDPDFGFFINDHTFVIPEHLCKYLEDKNPEEQIYHGHAMKNDKDVFNSGAAGYILSRATMKALVQKWDEEDPTCLLKSGRKWLQGNPGLVTAKCLKEVLNVEPVDTRNRGKYHRFHAFPLTRMVAGALDDWYRKKHIGMEKMMNTDESYDTLLSGAECCSHDTVSFHYVEHLETRALFATREALLRNPRMSDTELKNFIVREWPREYKEIGGYSRALPNETDEKEWKEFLQVMRKMSERQDQREC